MAIFNKDQQLKYSKSKITGTGYLVFRDTKKLIDLYSINTDKVLDFGCGFGRSTKYLSEISCNVVGMDICQNSVALAKKEIPSCQFYVGSIEDGAYKQGPYTAIFSFLTIFHFETKRSIARELQQSLDSLKPGGHLIIVGGTKNLFHRNYLTVKGLGPVPVNDGDTAKVKLTHIDCIIEDYYWSDLFVKNMSEKIGFTCCGIHYPLGRSLDKQEYLDELYYPPYYILILKK